MAPNPMAPNPAAGGNLTTRGVVFQPPVISVDGNQLYLHNIIATKPSATLAMIRCADYAAGAGAVPAPAAAAAPAAGGLFGGAATPGTAPAATNLFGAPATPAAPAAGGGLFGGAATTTPAATNLFGGAATPAAPAAGAGTGLFGAPAAATATTTTGFAANPFGAPTTPAATTAPTNLFGAPAATTPAAGGGLFGAAKPAAAPAAGASPFSFGQPAPSVTPPAGTTPGAGAAASPFSFNLTPAAAGTTPAAPAAASPFSFTPTTPAAAPTTPAPAAAAGTGLFNFGAAGQGAAAGAPAPATSLFGAAPQQPLQAQQPAAAGAAVPPGAELPIYGKAPSFAEMKERAARFLAVTRPKGADAPAPSSAAGAGARAYVPFVANPRHAFTRSLIRAKPRLFDFEVPENRPAPAAAGLFAPSPLAGLGGRALTGLDPAKLARDLFPDPPAAESESASESAAPEPMADPESASEPEGEGEQERAQAQEGVDEGVYPRLDAGSEYSITPSIAALRRLPAAALRAVEGVRVARRGYGWLEFAEPVDLTGVDVGAAFRIERSRVESFSPAMRGRRVHVHFECIYPDRVRAFAPEAAAAARARCRSKASRAVPGSVVSESGAWDLDTTI